MPIAHGTRSAMTETSRQSKPKPRTFEFDFIIFATGAETDLSARSELAPIVHQIALWRDRFTPPPGEESDLLADTLTSGRHLSSSNGSREPLLSSAGCTISPSARYQLGLTGAAITGIKYGVRRLVNGLVRDLFREDAASYYQDLLAFAVPELEILESAFAWAAALGADALERAEARWCDAGYNARRCRVAIRRRIRQSRSKRIRLRVPGERAARSPLPAGRPAAPSTRN